MILRTCLCVSAGEPGLGLVSAEADGVGAEPHDAGRHAHAGGPAPETAPPSGGGETQVPQPGGATHPAAAVSSEQEINATRKKNKESYQIVPEEFLLKVWCAS